MASPPQQPASSKAFGTNRSAQAWVPIKEWRSCREVAANMEALPPERLDQRLLSGALQHMAMVCAAG
jgi:hypothetical protein